MGPRSAECLRRSDNDSPERFIRAKEGTRLTAENGKRRVYLTGHEGVVQWLQCMIRRVSGEPNDRSIIKKIEMKDNWTMYCNSTFESLASLMIHYVFPILGSTASTRVL